MFAMYPRLLILDLAPGFILSYFFVKFGEGLSSILSLVTYRHGLPGVLVEHTAFTVAILDIMTASYQSNAI